MKETSNFCPCKSGLAFTECCLPFIQAHETTIKNEMSLTPPTPEKLMRSRYCAYAIQNYHYIINTYTASKAKSLSINVIENDCQHTQWLNLQIIHSSESTEKGEVEFVAFYKDKGEFFCMHERSLFIKELGQWKYHTGKVLDKTGKLKPERNKLCLCGSGKKFKRCCC
ncbi:YchJ family protein [Glaciecola petra]|uniref:YchJ family protein n=1 Tax=Glaciecola petra TaxID=3075602 RepID=A0ABU2ZLR0_9ALTE|nr:YchJ family protein [Aestuariibacter sp. P117]MDT0593560.1 YchJ family protein [Aestuariibacter sp. P117]